MLMLWFYISAIAILVGAEMNAEIEHASPHGKNPGEKVPGEKKKLGPAAARAYEEAQKKGSATPEPPTDEGSRLPAPPRVPGRWSVVAAYSMIAVDLIRTLKNRSSLRSESRSTEPLQVDADRSR
jgi:membrane protein